MKFNHKIHNLQELNLLKIGAPKVAILGGSFNPAHEGHLALTNEALKHYQFDYVLWLVAKQNPLKEKYKFSLSQRALQAAQLAKSNYKIIISKIEENISSYYSFDIINFLTKTFENASFTWLMGIDNLASIKKWHRYNEIADLCNIIIFDRPGKNRLINIQGILAKNETNNIIVHRGKLNLASSTKIRLDNKLF